MIAARRQNMDSGQGSALVLTVLQAAGRRTLDQLSTLAGMNWPQVFAVIDELSRNGTVRLRRVGNEYEVSLKEES